MENSAINSLRFPLKDPLPFLNRKPIRAVKFDKLTLVNENTIKNSKHKKHVFAYGALHYKSIDPANKYFELNSADASNEFGEGKLIESGNINYERKLSKELDIDNLELSKKINNEEIEIEDKIRQGDRVLPQIEEEPIENHIPHIDCDFADTLEGTHDLARVYSEVQSSFTPPKVVPISKLNFRTPAAKNCPKVFMISSCKHIKAKSSLYKPQEVSRRSDRSEESTPQASYSEHSKCYGQLANQLRSSQIFSANQSQGEGVINPLSGFFMQNPTKCTNLSHHTFKDKASPAKSESKVSFITQTNSLLKCSYKFHNPKREKESSKTLLEKGCLDNMLYHTNKSNHKRVLSHKSLVDVIKYAKDETACDSKK
eukprot:TRINITY_DN9434_c0_g3_i1.p1 TRINITY_DN9434_c0_g3~~TRINITY_DN9434_c0_g3_i1.p1  ORF type:complete len:370 (+),score=79.78 TRINITY_DN9434_c0_g3_i1:220-1329(+)